MTGEQVGAPNGHATGGTHATGPAASRRATGGGAHHVTAVLVSHNGQEYLGPTLDALRMGRRLPDAMVVVDTGSTDASLDRIAAAEPTAVLDLPPDTSFGGAVAAAEAHLPAPADIVPGDSVEWLWLVHDDAAPEPAALEALLQEAEQHPSAAILGPKVRGWHDRSLLLECGLSITSSGRRFTGIEPGDRDQGQRDDVADVLAVGSAGMLVRRDVWRGLDGFDPAIRIFGDDIEFCMRARRAGHDVRVVPGAVIHHREAALHGLRRTELPGLPPTLAARASGLYTALVHGPALLLPLTSLVLLARTLITALLLLIAEGPKRAAQELQVWGRVHLQPVQVAGARRRLRAVATVPRREVNRYRPGWLESWISAGEGSVGRARAGLRSSSVRAPFAFGQLAVMGALLAVVAAVATTSVWLESGDLLGGALLPTVDGTTLWNAFRSSWHDVGLGSAEPSAPYLLALIAAAAPPGVSMDLVLQTLLLFTVPLAGASAFLALRGFSKRLLRGVLAVCYSLTPTIVVPSLDGRVGTALVAILLPWLARALVRIFAAPGVTQLPPAKLRTTGAAVLLLAICAAAAPMVWVVVVAIALVAAVIRARRWGTWMSVLMLIVLPVVLLWPWSGGVFADPSRALFEAGVSSPELVAATPPGWLLLLLDPGTLGDRVAWAGGPLLALAVLALVLPRSRPVAVWGWLVFVSGLIGATVVTSLVAVPLGAAVAQHGFAGPMLIVMAAGLIVAAAALLQQVQLRPGFGRRLTALALALSLLAGPVWISFLWLSSWDGPLRRSEASVVPAFVTEQALSSERIRTVLLEDGPGASVAFSLSNGAGARLGDADVAPPAESLEDISSAVAGIVAGVGPEPVEVLASNAVRYIVAPAEGTGLAAALDGNSALRRLSTSDGRALWEVSGLTTRARQAGEGGAAPYPVVPPSETETPGTPLVTGDVTAPSAGALLVAQYNDGGWLATIDGQPAPVEGTSTTSVRLPGGDVAVSLAHDQAGRDRALLVPLLGGLLLLLMLLSWRRSAPLPPDPDAAVGEHPMPSGNRDQEGTSGTGAPAIDLTEQALESKR